MVLRDRQYSLLEDGFTPHEKEILTRILEVIDGKVDQFRARGLTKKSFCLGVANVLFVAWAFGAIPQHFWIVYLVEIAFLFPLRWHNQVTATPKQHFYWFDFCWFANFSGVLALLILAISDYFYEGTLVSESTRKTIFCALWGIGCGVLLTAVGLLNNALIFHDADNTASVLIHLFPSLVLFCMHWKRDKVVAAWPHMFHLDYFESMTWSDIYFSSLVFYLIWWVVYTLWLLIHGLRLPPRGFDTIFHYNMKEKAGFGNQIAKIPTIGDPEDFKRRRRDVDFRAVDVLHYMVGHAIGVMIGILVSLLCFQSAWIHGFLCAGMTFVTIYNGSGRYTYYMLDMYTNMIKEEVRKLGGTPHHGSSAPAVV